MSHIPELIYIFEKTKKLYCPFILIVRYVKDVLNIDVINLTLLFQLLKTNKIALP